VIFQSFLTKSGISFVNVSFKINTNPWSKGLGRKNITSVMLNKTLLYVLTYPDIEFPAGAIQKKIYVKHIYVEIATICPKGAGLTTKA
jgi:hypothetical protein